MQIENRRGQKSNIGFYGMIQAWDYDHRSQKHLMTECLSATLTADILPQIIHIHLDLKSYSCNGRHIRHLYLFLVVDTTLKSSWAKNHHVSQ